MSLIDGGTAFASGQPVVLLGADPRYGGPELVAAASQISPAVMAFIVRHTCGYVTVAMPASRCDDLQLPAVSGDRWAGSQPVPAVAVDAADGVTTGISAADRSRTARLLSEDGSTAESFTRPGHLVPHRVNVGAENSTGAAGLRLCAETGLSAAVVRCELVLSSGQLMSGSDALIFAAAHGLAALHVCDLARGAAA